MRKLPAIKADVVLAPPVSRSVTQSMFMPLGICYLTSYLKSRGLKVVILDYKDSMYEVGEVAKRKIRERTNYLLRDVGRLNPDYFGLSCNSREFNEVVNICKAIKLRYPHIKTVVGGAHASIRPHDLLNSGFVDYAVMGEGEITLYELVMSKGRGLDKIDGLGWKEGNKNIINKPRALIDDLSTMPDPDYDAAAIDAYTQPTTMLVRDCFVSGVPIFTSRGCPFSCIYCASKYILGRKIRYINPVKVVNQIERLVKKHNINGFYIMDDTFTLKKEHVMRFCQEIIDRKLNLVWGAETRVSLIDEDMIKIMKKAGCAQMDFGVESGSDRILKVLKKGTTSEEVIKAFDLCRKYKIRTLAMLLVGSPTETKEDVEETIKVVRRIKPSSVDVNITTPLPSTELEHMVFGDRGIPLEALANLNFKANAIYNLSELTLEELGQYRQKIVGMTRGRARFLIFTSMFSIPYIRSILRMYIRGPYKLRQTIVNAYLTVYKRLGRPN